jgi:hypothetical protein
MNSVTKPRMMMTTTPTMKYRTARGTIDCPSCCTPFATPSQTNSSPALA